MGRHGEAEVYDYIKLRYALSPEDLFYSVREGVVVWGFSHNSHYPIQSDIDPFYVCPSRASAQYSAAE